MISKESRRQEASTANSFTSTLESSSSRRTSSDASADSVLHPRAVVTVAVSEAQLTSVLTFTVTYVSHVSY